MTTNNKRMVVVEGSDHAYVDDFSVEFSTLSGKIAIIDAALLDSIDTKLTEKALIVSTKSQEDITYTIDGKFDETLLRSLVIRPKHVEGSEDEIEVDTSSSEDDEDMIIPKEAMDQKHRPGSKLNLTGSGHDSSVERKLRNTSTQRKHQRSSGRHLPDPTRVGPKRRGRNNKPLSDAKQFIVDRIGKKILKEDIQSVEDPHLLKYMVGKMFYMCRPGWSLMEDKLVHRSGIEFSSDSWNVNVDGYLVDKDDNPPEIDFNWIYDFKTTVDSVLNEEMRDLTLDTIMESVSTNKQVISEMAPDGIGQLPDQDKFGEPTHFLSIDLLEANPLEAISLARTDIEFFEDQYELAERLYGDCLQLVNKGRPQLGQDQIPEARDINALPDKDTFGGDWAIEIALRAEHEDRPGRFHDMDECGLFQLDGERCNALYQELREILKQKSIELGAEGGFEA